MVKYDNKWEEIAERKQKAILDAIPEKWRGDFKEHMRQDGVVNTKEFLDSILPDDDLQITGLTLVRLQERLASGQLTATRVAQAYCRRAALAHQILNCCSDIFFDEAFKQAKWLDDEFKRMGGPIGPLHGIPISLKDQVDLKGRDSTLGYVSRAEKPKKKNALIAQQLLEAGAVFYVKTAVPSSLMASETYSNLNGYTSNALNINFSAGGSSGGEGALIGAGASPCGFGTDIGGSIRIPACFQGLYALKPSSGRLSYMDVSNSSSGQECVVSSIGPMARSLEDLEYVTEVLVNAGASQFDPKVLPIPWRKVNRNKKFTIGIWCACSELRPLPPITRTLYNLKEHLEDEGHVVKYIDLPMSLDALTTATKIYVADAGKEAFSECAKSGESLIDAVKKCVPWETFDKPLGVNEWWDLCNEAYKIRQEFLAYWQKTADETYNGEPIDAIICPVWPIPALPKHGPNTENYTMPFNLFDCACTVVPVGSVSAALDDASYYKPRNETEKSVLEVYDPEVYDGFPVCVQVVTRKLEEELSLAVARACVPRQRSEWSEDGMEV